MGCHLCCIHLDIELNYRKILHNRVERNRPLGCNLGIYFIKIRYRAYGGNIKNVAIIGFDKKGVEFYNTINNNLHLGIMECICKKNKKSIK